MYFKHYTNNKSELGKEVQGDKIVPYGNFKPRHINKYNKNKLHENST